MEILKLIEEDSIHTLMEFYNRIYVSGAIPQEWLLSTFVIIQKKVYAKQCNIIHIRIYTRNGYLVIPILNSEKD